MEGKFVRSDFVSCVLARSTQPKMNALSLWGKSKRTDSLEFIESRFSTTQNGRPKFSPEHTVNSSMIVCALAKTSCNALNLDFVEGMPQSLVWIDGVSSKPFYECKLYTIQLRHSKEESLLARLVRRKENSTAERRSAEELQ